MTIARELVTRLSFAFDRTNLDKFERTISGFKTKFDIGRLAIQSSFGKILDFATEFSDKILKQDALSKFSKTSIQDLDALQKKFQQFDVPTDVFQGFFSNISQQLAEINSGYENELRHIISRSGGFLNAYVNGQLISTKDFIDKIRIYLKSFADEADQLQVIQKIFKTSPETSVALLNAFRAASMGLDEFISKEKISIEELQRLKESAIEFKKEVASFNVQAEKLQQEAAKYLIPALVASVGGVNLIIDEVKENGVGSAAGLAYQGIIYGILSAFGVQDLKSIESKVLSSNLGFFGNMEEGFRKQEEADRNTIINNNKFEFNVPPGTEEQTAQFISQEVQVKLENMWDQKTREVINNSPQVE